MGGITQQEKVVLDGADGSVLSDLLFPDDFPATVIVRVSAGVCDVQYSCNKVDDIKADPDAAAIEWIDWDFGQVAAGTPGVNALVAPITALRLLPVGGDATINYVGMN